MADYTGTTTYREPWTEGIQRLTNTILQVYQLNQAKKQQEQAGGLAKLQALLQAGEKLGFTPEMRRSMEETGTGLGIKLPTYRPTGGYNPPVATGAPVSPPQPGAAPTLPTMPQVQPGGTASVGATSTMPVDDMDDFGTELRRHYQANMELGMTSEQAIQLASETAKNNISQKRWSRVREDAYKMEQEYSVISNRLATGKYKNRKEYEELRARARLLLAWRNANPSWQAGIIGEAAPQALDRYIPGYGGAGEPTPTPGGANNDPLGIR